MGYQEFLQAHSITEVAGPGSDPWRLAGAVPPARGPLIAPQVRNGREQAVLRLQL